MNSLDSFHTLDSLNMGGKEYTFYNISKLHEKYPAIEKLPKSKKILIENLLRLEDGKDVNKDLIEKVLQNPEKKHEIFFLPARVLMQDFTGVPAVADLAAMRNAVALKGKDPANVNPLSQVDLVIDHSVMVDYFATPQAFQKNVDMEFGRNKERYEFLKWGQQAFENFRVIPPGTGICHQVNLEYLARVVWNKPINGKECLYPDTLVGTDSHTTMVNALGVLGWGVGGIEAEAAMLGQSVSMLLPEVVGFKIDGSLQEGVTATDLVLTVVEMLRTKGVVGKFVEFYGDGVKNLSLADRATIANMAPEYGATCGFFSTDEETIKYLNLTARDKDLVKIVEKYNKIQGLWMDNQSEYNDNLELNLMSVQASLAGPKRPQDRINLNGVSANFQKLLQSSPKKSEVKNHNYQLSDGDVVIAAITSCTNTSNPNVLVAAGLVAKKAGELGMQVKPWVKTSLAPGSKVVTDYLNKSDLTKHLDSMGFHLVGYGCTTCIGNSGPLHPDIADAINENNLTVASVLSGNRNFEGRVNPHVKANYLASPPLVVAYALAGTVNIDLSKDALGVSSEGKEIFLKDIWPSNEEINSIVGQHVSAEMFSQQYSNALQGPKEWQNIQTSEGGLYQWKEESTYVQKPPFFDTISEEEKEIQNIDNARPLLLLGNSVTTDHISPAGAIKQDSPAGSYFMERQILQKDFNSYGARRGNHEVMVRGTFANIRIKNELLSDVEGGYSILEPEKKQMSVYEVAMEYQKRAENTVVFAGQEYGTGSSRDWAAKGTKLLGIKAVIAESFERIHRSNLIGMGVLPIQLDNTNIQELGIKSSDLVDIKLHSEIKPLEKISVIIKQGDASKDLQCTLRIDTINELQYYKSDGILNFVLNNILKD
ncbi:MAG: aconitate hydratase AcnA [alpha proteobacterium HIMB59]|nr:MAG: aconitate hydratase AcnA [alpha proteobacterium HIMB59]